MLNIRETGSNGKLPESMKQALRDRVWTKDDKIKMRRPKPVIQLTLNGEFIKEWSEMQEAAKAIGVTPPNISDCIRGKQKSSGGFKWMRPCK